LFDHLLTQRMFILVIAIAQFSGNLTSLLSLEISFSFLLLFYIFIKVNKKNNKRKVSLNKPRRLSQKIILQFCFQNESCSLCHAWRKNNNGFNILFAKFFKFYPCLFINVPRSTILRKTSVSDISYSFVWIVIESSRFFLLWILLYSTDEKMIWV
jgi:hypothetical protein